jgi:cation diffusion facilitator family transporter
MIKKQKCTRCASRITWIGLWDSLFLAIFKGIIGIFSRSHALVASALYSIHDIISGAAVIIGVKIASRPIDRKYPYGYGNAEYIVSVFTSILIIGATIFLMGSAIKTIFKGSHSPPHWAALGAAIISLFANEVIYHYNICAFKHLNSPAIFTHAKHHRADAISSLAVIIALVGAKTGLSFLDPLVALFEAVHLIVLSGEILHHGGSGLMDKAIKERDISSIRNILAGITDIKDIKDIKSRQIGRYIWIDLYLCLSSDITIINAHGVSSKIRQALKNSISYLENINIIYV